MLNGQLLSQNELVGNIQSQVVEGATADGVSDVRVNGTSVVINGVAYIDLSHLEKAIQDILAIIQGGEISSLNVSKIEELLVSYFENKIVSEVEN